jgi:hypothetical protein
MHSTAQPTLIPAAALCLCLQQLRHCIGPPAPVSPLSPQIAVPLFPPCLCCCSCAPPRSQLLESLRAEAAEAERKRLIRKQRSERIPTAPKRTQDPVLFQAITRKWDEKMTQEELRGARATARKVGGGWCGSSARQRR